eukprot:gene18919-20823_t
MLQPFAKLPSNIKNLQHIIKRFGYRLPRPFEWYGKPSDVTQNNVLCSGQGSQYVGMFHECTRERKPLPEIINLIKTANSILGYDVIQLCFQGPKSKLDKTVYCQPIVVLANLVGAELMREDKPWLYETNMQVAGYSVGEIAALNVAGAITAEQGATLSFDLRIFRARAEAMQRASDLTASALYFVNGIPRDELNLICEEIMNERKNKKPNSYSFAGIAIDAYPKGCVVGATIDCEKQILGLATDKVTVKELPVSGAFHTPVMRPAQEIFKETLDKTEISMPKYDLFSNVTGEKYTSTDEIKSMLLRQLTEPVQWQSLLNNMYKRPALCRTCELGTGTQLRAMMARYDRKTLKKYFSYRV